MINARMVNFWCRDSNWQSKQIFFYNLFFDKENARRSKQIIFPQNGLPNWLTSLTELVLLFIGPAQHNNDMNFLKSEIKTRISDIANQNWCSDVDSNSACANYRIYKKNIDFEKYLVKLDFADRLSLCRFRCGSIKLPSNRIFITRNIDLENVDMTCKLCTLDVIGDEYHNLFECNTFSSKKTKYRSPYYWRHPNTMFELFNSSDIKTLRNLAKLTKIIQDVL